MGKFEGMLRSWIFGERRKQCVSIGMPERRISSTPKQAQERLKQSLDNFHETIMRASKDLHK